VKPPAARVYTFAPLPRPRTQSVTSSSNGFSCAFIGAGNMAGSIIRGLLRAGTDAQSLRAADPSAANLEALRELGLKQTDADNRVAAAEADVVVLAVKPQILRAVCEELAGTLHPEQTIISIAAGVATDSLSRWLGGHAAVVRCMPNTPALLRSGATALYAPPRVTALQRARAEEVLAAVGIVAWVDDEELLHAVTAVSGSGPAYFFQFMEAMIAEGQRLGLDADSARRLCAQTCIGAGRMVAEGSVEAAELRRRVCSPGGTTERAVARFSDDDLAGLVSRAMRDCYERSQEMTRELS
jgi:pyrroline-5-carboxylate reductase